MAKVLDQVPGLLELLAGRNLEVHKLVVEEHNLAEERRCNLEEPHSLLGEQSLQLEQNLEGYLNFLGELEREEQRHFRYRRAVGLPEGRRTSGELPVTAPCNIRRTVPSCAVQTLELK